MKISNKQLFAVGALAIAGAGAAVAQRLWARRKRATDFDQDVEQIDDVPVVIAEEVVVVLDEPVL